MRWISASWWLILVPALAGCGEPVSREGSRVEGAKKAANIALGQQLYAVHCATCHGKDLEGQPNWRSRLLNGKLPAPPHDESGHTWHHSDEVLFSITKFGMVPPNAPQHYRSDMPAFGDKLADFEIRSVLAYIAGHWQSSELLKARAQMVRSNR